MADIRIAKAIHQRKCCVCGLAIEAGSQHYRENSEAIFRWRDYHLDCTPKGDESFEPELWAWKAFTEGEINGKTDN